LGTLYFTLASIWDLPAAQEVVNTIIAVDTFLGVILQISNANYNSKKVGDIEVQELETGVKTYSLNLEGQPEEIEDVDEARFKVVKGGSKPATATSHHRTGSRRKH
jgi:hypothetical protein